MVSPSDRPLPDFIISLIINPHTKIGEIVENWAYLEKIYIVTPKNSVNVAGYI